MAARISLRVKSGCLATRVKSHSECSSSGEVLPPLGLASTLPVSLQRRHHRITELTPTSNTSATSRRDAPLSTASTARSRKSVEYGFGIDLAPRRINFSRFAWAKAVGNPPDSMPPGNALVINGIGYRIPGSPLRGAPRNDKFHGIDQLGRRSTAFWRASYERSAPRAAKKVVEAQPGIEPGLMAGSPAIAFSHFATGPFWSGREGSNPL